MNKDYYLSWQMKDIQKAFPSAAAPEYTAQSKWKFGIMGTNALVVLDTIHNTGTLTCTACGKFVFSTSSSKPEFFDEFEVKKLMKEHMNGCEVYLKNQMRLPLQGFSAFRGSEDSTPLDRMSNRVNELMWVSTQENEDERARIINSMPDFALVNGGRPVDDLPWN